MRYFIPTENVWDAVRAWRDVNGLEPAGGVEEVAGRFVFDLWGGRYGQSARALRQAFSYGLTDSMVIWHNWQRWGYDYRLPNIYPPNPGLGTLEEIKDLIAACKESGVPVALHDNYIDFYPDADGFSYEENIAFGRDGTPVKAWLNGKLVHKNLVTRGVVPDNDRVPVTFKKGRNQLVLKILNYGGPWGLACRPLELDPVGQ